MLAVISIFGLAGCGPPGARDLHKGERLLDRGQYADAVPVLKESVELLRQSPAVVQAHAWNLLGLAYHGAGQMDPAAQAYGQALKLDRNLWAADYNLGCLRLEQANYQGAVDYLTTYTTSHAQAQDYGGYLLLGRARLHMAMSTPYDRNRQFDNAKMDYDYAEQLHPTAEGCNALGLIELLRRTNPTSESVKTALGYFETALQRTPHYPPALLNLAIVQQRYMNSPKEALATYKEYLSSQPTPADAAEVQKAAHQLDLDMRITIVPKMVERPAPATPTPSNAAPVRRDTPPAETQQPVRPAQQPNYRTPPPETRAPPQPAPVEVRVAENPTPHSAVGNPSPPVVAANSSSPQNPPSTLPPPEIDSSPTTPPEERKTFIHKLNPLTWFSGKSKKTNSVEKPGPAQPTVVDRYTYPLSVTPIPGDRIQAQRLTSEGRQAQHDSDRATATRDFQAAIKADPTFFEPALALGLMALDGHDYATALDGLGQALMVQPNSADARYAFAWVLGKKGYYQDAANELERLLAAHPNEVRAHLLLGNIYADDLGQPKMARQQYLKSLELVDSQSPQAETIRAWLEQNQR